MGSGRSAPGRRATLRGGLLNLELVLAEERAQIAVARRQRLGAGVRGGVERVVLGAVAAAAHREGVLPRGHVSLELGAGGGQLVLQSVMHAALSDPDVPLIESAD